MDYVYLPHFMDTFLPFSFINWSDVLIIFIDTRFIFILCTFIFFPTAQDIYHHCSLGLLLYYIDFSYVIFHHFVIIVA